MRDPVRLLALVLVLGAMVAAGCGGDDEPAAPYVPDPSDVTVKVGTRGDTLVVEGANVVLFEAGRREPVARAFTDENGKAYFRVHAGDYFTEISAQGYHPSPPKNISAIPFYVPVETATEHEVRLDALDTPATGYVWGYVQPAINNVLLVAQSMTDQDSWSTASGPDGFFVFFNMPADSFAIDGLKAGYEMNGEVLARIDGSASVDTVTVPMTPYTGSSLHGSVTFLAVENSVVDITLLDARTRQVVPGLTTTNAPSALTWRIDGIPDGDYLAWATLKNDGYVIDPDWMFKNPGGLEVSFTGPTVTELDFSVTGTISLVSPTNPASSTQPAVVDTTRPTFEWLPYPSTKEYFVEVRDLAGRYIWGGFQADGTSNHGFIGAATTSVVYNFDEQPGAPELVPGETYQWRIWADKGTAADNFVEQLISASEDLRGLFHIAEPPPPPDPPAEP